MRLKTHHATGLLILIVAATIGLLIVARQYWFPGDPIDEDQIGVPAGQQLIKEPWISFLAPKETENSGFEVVMNVLQPLSSIEVDWSHPASGEEDQYVLAKYRSGSEQARYIVRSDLGNFLPGKNDYTIIAIHPSPGIPDQTYRVSFSVEWNIDGMDEIQPELITFTGLPETTDARELELVGNISVPADSIQITSFHPKRGQASFRLLNQYKTGDKEFHYFAKLAFGNFYSGENIYVVEALDAQKNILSRKKIMVVSTTMTVEDQVEGWFGTLKPLQDGWFVSSKLPWFTVRPVYDKLLFRQTRTDDNILLPRPALMYTAQASKDTPLCDYLKSLDYDATGVSYVGNSFETCQQYRHGVSVYDRFISPLTYKPFDIVRRIDYKALTDKVSSSFLMIENGGMQEREESKILSFEQMAELSDKDEPEKLPEDPSAPPAPRFYLYQFLITEEVPLTEEEMPDVASEISAEKKALIEEIRAFLNTHPGDEIFTPLLFPVIDDTLPDQDSAKVVSGASKE